MGRSDDGYSTGVFAVTGKAMPPIDIQQLLRPSAYPHAVGEIRLRETHVSWVILTGDFSYKLKKPVKLDFLDMTSLSRRHQLCREELRLNRRLAPDLYLEVVTVTRDSQGLRVGGAGSIVDYAVKMRQFDASEELPSLLERDDVSCAEIAALADRLARFHENAARVAAAADFDYQRQLRQSVLGNLATLIAHRPAGTKVPELGHLSDWTHDEMHDLLPSFAERQAHGFVRECHGDLHAANIVRWEGRLTPFDCLEFDPNLRFIDVMGDIAFLYMDLKSYRRQDLASQLLSGYLEATGDYAGVHALAFHAVYRALVRAMVDALGAEQRPADAPALTQRFLARTRTAMEFTRQGRPTLYIMHGASGSGKSWLSARLVPMLGAVRIRSDVERKRMGSGTAELYAPQSRERVYRHMMACAEASLAAGLRTIVDASFLSLADRLAFRALAARRRADFTIIACMADKAELIRRIGARSALDPSDADAAVLEAQLDRMEALTPEEEACVVRVDTTASDWAQQFRAASG
jgi:aminoglycoside phosphotransferase family enzyme/predicted kinase